MNETNAPQTNGLAVASLVLGIFAVTGLGPLTGIPAIITGALGLKNPTNKGLAIAGIIMGVVSIIFLVLIVLLFVVLIGIGANTYDSYDPQDSSGPTEDSSYQQRA